MAGTVLDSFALLAYFRDEEGADKVQQLLERASRKGAALLMTEVNYAEVKYITLRKQGAEAWRQVQESLTSLPLEFVPVGRELSDIAADFKSRVSLSLADAFAAALAKQRKAELVTCDSEFKSLEVEIKIQWLQK
ncbi:MAG: PIN domain-containing protein [Stenotrophobium sp.]